MPRLPACVISLLAISMAGSALADYATTHGSKVIVNGVEVMTLRTSSPKSRAAEVAARIRGARESAQISVRASRRKRVIRLGSSILVTVSKAEAEAAGSSIDGLTSTWAGNLKSALALPPIKVLNAPGIVPLGGQRTFKIIGSKAHIAKWRIEPAGRLGVKRQEGMIEVTGRALGESALVFTTGYAETKTAIKVLPLAALFPQKLTAVVSGLPAQEDIVRGAVETSLRTGLRGARGVQLKMDLASLWQLEPGTARTATIRVRAEAPNAFPSEGTVNVLVRNVGLGYAREEALWYSNDPENVKAPGTLMHGDLAAGKAVRLLYHHINDSAQGLYVQVEAINNSDKEARLLIIPGDSEPALNPVLAGIVAGERFLKRWLTASGEVLTVPPKTRIPLALRRLGPQETMSGLCSLWLLEDGPSKLEVRVQAHAPLTQAALLAAQFQSETPWRHVSPSPLDLKASAGVEFEHVYPNPFRSAQLAYLVGGRYGFVRIGEKAISRADQNGTLSGNFGVLYRIEVAADNPTEVASDLELLFEASAGYSGALFVLNGGVMRTPLLQPKTSARILRIKLEPGQTKRFDLYTMPLSGSSYPATVILRPVELGSTVAADLSARWANKL